MKILVFGGAGYLGGWVTPLLLASGHEVTVFDRLLFGPAAVAPLAGRPGFRLIEADLRDARAVAAAVRGQQAVILLASLVGEAACARDPADTVAVNYLGPLSALRAAAYYGVERFIFTSTDSCYGAQEKVILTEDSPLQPLSLYADLKARVEREILALDRPPGFHPTVLRLATLYGPAPRMRFDLILNLLTREAALGRGARIFSGEQWRPLVHVRDAARAFALAAAAEPEAVSGQIFNVGSNHQNVQFKDLGALLRRVLPEAVVETVPQPPDLRDYRVSFDKIRATLRFSPEFEPEDGIKAIRDGLAGGAWGNPDDPRHRNA
ncbi:MAG: NAD(P)-dependent oxidoreductase [Candidatus Adiutrix sp.]|jgi:nucleoside-diphosphate-sugar epimerase|nr:NAD(P)-dependent oxidoreductase [Candidatus Adiutrix sp.]